MAVQPNLYSADPIIPPFEKYLDLSANLPESTSARVRLTCFLDKEKPLSEPRWVKNGDIEEWLKNMFGAAKGAETSVRDDRASSGWNGKIRVIDPDPSPTIHTAIDNWAQQHNPSGGPQERKRFVKEHQSGKFDKMIEILLRKARNDRILGGGSNNVSLSAGGQQPLNPFNTSVNNSPLLSTAYPSLTPQEVDSIYAGGQNHITLVILSMCRMISEYASQAGAETTAVEARILDLIRHAPSNLINKSLDSMFRDWSNSQKNAKVTSRN